MRGGPPSTAVQQGETRLLDEDAQLEISKLPNVIEVFPQVRFLLRGAVQRQAVRHDGGGHAAIFPKAAAL